VKTRTNLITASVCGFHIIFYVTNLHQISFQKQKTKKVKLFSNPNYRIASVETSL